MKRRGDKTLPCRSPTPIWNGFDCHLPEHKPPVGSTMTKWRVTADHLRHTTAKPSKVYLEELDHMLFQHGQSMQRDFCHTQRFLEDLLQNEDLVLVLRLGQKQQWSSSSFASTISRHFLSSHLAYTFPCKLRNDILL